ncbi:MAG: glycosyltransferase [Deltaproteobacteria bacterium]|nr:glycosyltransferase [Deltaproteobacteria bacterium]
MRCAEAPSTNAYTPTLSVILPVFNEAESLPVLYHRLTQVLRNSEEGYELIFVNDGSSDRSSELLQELVEHDPRVRVVALSRNFGHQVALSAGLDHSRGRAVAIMDADLQDPPEVLLRFMEQWRRGYAVVYAVRKHRKEGILKRSAYALFYLTFKSIADIEVPLDAGDFCLLDRRVVDILVALPEHHRFLRGLRSWVGFKQMGIEYERDERYGGASKYSLRQLVQLALSGYIGFSLLPLRAATWCGFFSTSVGFLLLLWVLITRFLQSPPPHGWASTIAAILFIGGVQLLMLGIIGEYLGRVYDEVRQRPLYIVQARLGFAVDHTRTVVRNLAKPVADEAGLKS